LLILGKTVAEKGKISMSQEAEPLMNDDERAALRASAEAALDELTVSLTQVFKAVNRVHKVVSRLTSALDSNSATTVHKDDPNSEE
jgi:hypothetical protein